MSVNSFMKKNYINISARNYDPLFDPFETYLITVYNDADHYAETVNKMKKDPTYRSLSEGF